MTEHLFGESSGALDWELNDSSRSDEATSSEPFITSPLEKPPMGIIFPAEKIPGPELLDTFLAKDMQMGGEKIVLNTK